MLVQRRFQRPLTIIIVLVTLTVTLSLSRFRSSTLQDFLAHYRHKTPGSLVGEHQKGDPEETCAPEIEYVKKTWFSGVDLTDNIFYSRRCVKPVFASEVDRDGITQVNDDLIRGKVAIDLKSCKGARLPPCEPLHLKVPKPYPEERYPHLLFGVSTKYERLNDSLDAFTYWLSGTGSRMIAVVNDAISTDGKTSYNLTAMEELYEKHNISLTTVARKNESLTTAQNHFSIIEDLVEVVDAHTQWLVLIDDDTFFPSLYNVNEELHRHNPDRPVWLGAMTEDIDSIKHWGYMAYGGAGVFLSVPLARALVPHIPSCLASPRLPTGDGLLRDCIFNHTTTKLTQVPGLHQHDLQGDLAGFFESGVLPLSLHHWKSWYKEPVAAMAAVNRVCGDCFLQRFRFGRHTLLANGFSVAQYRRNLLDHLDLTKMEGTWSQAGREFELSMGALRPALSEEDKRSYRLKGSRVDDDGTLHQVYVYTGDFLVEEPDEIFELVWEKPKRRPGVVVT